MISTRVAGVGLDGMPHDLIARLAADGVMARTSELIASGSLRTMRASLPEISSVSWSSFMTGTNPGRHGIFGFTNLVPETYELYFPSFRDLAVPTLWDRLGETGIGCLVINQPATYPARPIPGVLISGFVAIDLRRAVSPLRHLAALRRMDYRIDVDIERCAGSTDLLFDELEQTLETRAAAVRHLWSEVDWRYLQVVITGTDRLYHFLWDSVVDPRHPRHERTMEYHRAVDGLVGEIYDRFYATDGGSRERFWMLSDHGFCGIKREFNINAWLQQQGYLDFLDKHELDRIAPRSRAFALDPGRIYIHRSDRYPRGCVNDNEAIELKQEIAAKLERLRCEQIDTLVVQQVLDAEKVYDGPLVSVGPDLLVLPHRGFDVKGSVAAGKVFSRSSLVGMHTYEDAFLISPCPLEGDPWIGDIAPLLIAQLTD